MSKTQPARPCDCDGQPLMVGDRVGLVDPFGRPQGPQGTIIDIGRSPWRSGGWPVLVDVDDDVPSHRGGHQVRLLTPNPGQLGLF